MATYRVQLHAGFTFSEARKIVDYLDALGISHLYCSPYMRAAAGSMHGYDVVDPTEVSPELGGDAGLAALSRALDARGMSQLLDIVPNHMGIADPANRWWWDVLKHGSKSRYARVFDINWNPPDPDLANRVLMPILAAPLEEVIAAGELEVVAVGDELRLRYFDRELPLSGESEAGANVDALNTPAAISDLVDRQHYLLQEWRSGLRRLNYRRFFDVRDLVGVRQEDPQVFEASHARIIELFDDSIIDGVRVDHVDGLREPWVYLERLRDRLPGGWIVVEKILAPGETLRAEWPVEGTTGYDFCARVTGLLVDPAGLAAIESAYADLTGDNAGFPEVAARARRDVLDQLLEAEVTHLKALARDAGIASADAGVEDLLSAIPVYRTYGQGEHRLSRQDQAIAEAAREIAGPASDLLVRTLSAPTDAANPGTAAELRACFQQVSPAAIAKGVEDTAFYRSLALVALNEVGGQPGSLTSVAEFHALAEDDAHLHPHALLATSTHDTKRGEDCRARIAALTSQPDLWLEATRRWEIVSSHHGGGAIPARLRWLLYQTAVGAHPLDPDRGRAYMLKAAREAKLETSWLSPDDAFEAALGEFTESLLADPEFAADVAAYTSRFDTVARVLSLSQALLKLTAPGVPDIYQGCELWDHSLVDPDNRRAVDYGLRRRLLDEVCTLTAEAILQRTDEGLPKLHLLRCGLALRRRRAASFAPGAVYFPLDGTGKFGDTLLAFGRGADASVDVVALAPLRPGATSAGWGDTSIDLPAGRWRSVLDPAVHTGGRQPISDLLAAFPVGLFEREA